MISSQEAKQGILIITGELAEKYSEIKGSPINGLVKSASIEADWPHTFAHKTSELNNMARVLQYNFLS
jgi:hypothetical protein